jgi:hypothetical protein
MSVSSLVSNNNMADMRNCEAVATQVSPNLEIYNAVYGPWNNMHCVEWRVSEVQDEGNITVQLSE